MRPVKLQWLVLLDSVNKKHPDPFKATWDTGEFVIFDTGQQADDFIMENKEYFALSVWQKVKET